MRDPKFNASTYNAASVAIANGQTNNDVRTNNVALWNGVDPANVMVLSTDQTITIRLNSTSNNAIVMTSTESPKKFDAMKITNLFVTNASGSTANLKIELYS